MGNNNGTCKLTAFKFIVEENRKDKSKECGDADYGNGSELALTDSEGSSPAKTNCHYSDSRSYQQRDRRAHV